jgi:lipoate-protein ligase A
MRGREAMGSGIDGEVMDEQNQGVSSPSTPDLLGSPATHGQPCRLILDGPSGGAWQMAVDEVLLESAAEAGQATLRFYQWSEPTLSLGYFQSFHERRKHIPSRDCALVRRQTGGGAILHDREWTYSLTLPLAHPLATDATRLYEAVHAALKATLAHWQIDVNVLEASSRLAPHEQPFLCFERRAQGDVLCGTVKICGSAQRRRRGAILQHGSLLLARSPHAPELPGLREITGQKLEHEPVIERWTAEIAPRLGLQLAAGQLSGLELDAVRTLALEKYSGFTWTERR